jgi:hypothetical protein
MKELVGIYLENKTQKANRLGLSRKTLNNWQRLPRSAKLSIIRQDVLEMARLVIQEEAEREGRSRYSRLYGFTLELERMLYPNGVNDM